MILHLTVIVLREREAALLADLVTALGERREVRCLEKFRHAGEARVHAEVVAEAVQRVDDHRR